MTPGGTNGPTHNALIVFSDDTYIELIALQSSGTRFVMRVMRRFGLFRRPGKLENNLQKRLLTWMAGPQGLIDLCLRGADLNSIDETSPIKSLSLTDPEKFKRYRPDGLVVEWTLRGSLNLRQPFFIQDSTPIDYRIPTGDARVHKNGAVGISEVRTPHTIEPAVSNVRLKTDPSLSTGSISVTLLSELPVTDRIEGPHFFNADITLTPSISMCRRT